MPRSSAEGPERGRDRRAGSGDRPRTRSAVRPSERRDGKPLIFGWGGHLTRAEKQRLRERLVVAAGGLIFLIVALVIGIGALQQYYLAPRAAVATVNGVKIERQWLDTNVSYRRAAASYQAQQEQNQLQSVVANQRATAAAASTASATANPSAAGTTGPSATPTASGSASAVPSQTGTAPSGTPAATFTPAPTLNPQQSATVSALQHDLAKLQQQYSTPDDQVLQDLIDDELMRQHASDFGISVSAGDVTKQSQQAIAQLGGQASSTQVLKNAGVSQDDFNRIQQNAALRDKFRAYFATNPDKAPPATPTPVPTATPTLAPTEGPGLPASVTPIPTLTPEPTPTPEPGQDALDRWLAQVAQSAKITRSPLPIA